MIRVKIIRKQAEIKVFIWYCFPGSTSARFRDVISVALSTRGQAIMQGHHISVELRPSVRNFSFFDINVLSSGPNVVRGDLSNL